MLVVPGAESLWLARMLVVSFRGACKLQILASLRMFRKGHQYLQLWAYPIGLCLKRNQLFGCLFGYLLGVKYALVPHLDWTHFNFPTSIHAPFHMEFPSLMSRLLDEGSDLKKRTWGRGSSLRFATAKYVWIKDVNRFLNTRVTPFPFANIFFQTSKLMPYSGLKNCTFELGRYFCSYTYSCKKE